MEWREFDTKASLAGLPHDAARLLYDVFALKGHEHTADDVIADPADGETQMEFNSRVSEAISELSEETEDETEDETIG